MSYLYVSLTGLKYYVVDPSIWISIQSRMWRIRLKDLTQSIKPMLIAHRVKYKSFTGIIPNTVLTDHTFVSFPDAKGFLSKKTIIGEMWVERLPGEMISTSCPMFVTEWPGFHKFTRGPCLMTFFSGSPASGWTRNFRVDCIELP